MEKIKNYLRFIEKNEELKVRLKEFEQHFLKIEANPDSPELKELHEKWLIFANEKRWHLDGKLLSLNQIQDEIDTAVACSTEEAIVL